MFHQQFGVMNYLLHLFGFTDTVNIAWTQQPSLAMLLVVMAAVWRQLPYMMVMILAAVSYTHLSAIRYQSEIIPRQKNTQYLLVRLVQQDPE